MQTSDLVLERLMTLHPKVIDLVLDRVYRLLEALGNPHQKLPPVIHVAGTNGKGSTLAFLRAMLEADGKSVHVYTSPHLVRFHERIRLAGELISETDLMALLERCEEANGKEAITYFEITTVAAFLAFSETSADYLLLETGLGGRLDATNVVEQPALTLITPISQDHAQFLGEDLSGIAFEKAGILKKNVPCLSALQTDNAEKVLEKRANELSVPLSFIQPENFDSLSLLGDHQKQNAALASAAARKLGINEDAIEKGRQTATWAGRFQKLDNTSWNALLTDDMELWIDGGHNAAAGKAIAEFARKNWADKPIHIVYGILNTKDAGAFLGPIADMADSLQAIEIPDQVSSLTAMEAAEAHRTAQPAVDLTSALKTLPQEPCRVLVCGSLYLVGWLLAQN